jgi:ribosomal protein S18 acetylase RimI-like enzyme
MDFLIKGPLLGQAAVCEPILRALPDWFGIEEALVHYTHKIDHLPTFLVSQGEQVIGFVSLKEHNPYAAEVYVMGIRAAAHRQGIGRTLLSAGEAFLRSKGIEYLQVKTLASSHPDEGYAKTRAFYLAVGFRPLEELTDLWGPENPCLLLIKKL